MENSGIMYSFFPLFLLWIKYICSKAMLQLQAPFDLLFVIKRKNRFLLEREEVVRLSTVTHCSLWYHICLSE